ncbi:MAG: hypothetical protein JOZ90_07025 [Alphaproteobacteria bacterium]|nr:hypothetical protein [Alphaproteobacteria bacterium]MBV9370425.1 hypothetical protein [Alphaproteobacteria bacterium]MBV9900835.1 hypothetical protein [Alphaproteobacteria bacterium]
MRKMVAAAALAATLALAGCGRGGDNQGGLTAEDNAQLNNAAEMLDTSPDSLVPAGNAVLGNGEDGAMDAVEEAAPANAAGNAN